MKETSPWRHGHPVFGKRGWPPFLGSRTVRVSVACPQLCTPGGAGDLQPGGDTGPATSVSPGWTCTCLVSDLTMPGCSFPSSRFYAIQLFSRPSSSRLTSVLEENVLPPCSLLRIAGCCSELLLWRALSVVWIQQRLWGCCLKPAKEGREVLKREHRGSSLSHNWGCGGHLAATAVTNAWKTLVSSPAPLVVF